METRLSGSNRQVIIGDGQPTVLIGERINPSGKKWMAEAFRTGNYDCIRQEALAQVEAGANIIDVNVNTFGTDETTILPEVVSILNETVDVPLCLDSVNVEALSRALEISLGKSLINSVTGEESRLASILPLVKEFGAAVIGLVQDEEGIPGSPERRVAVATKIIQRAEAVGIPREDVIIDSLAQTVGANAGSGITVLETIAQVKSRLGVNQVVAASNVSFGLPGREQISGIFAAMAIAAGVNCLIVDVAKTRTSVLTADLLMARDNRARRFIAAFRKRL